MQGQPSGSWLERLQRDEGAHGGRMESSARCCATAGAHQHGAAKQQGASQKPHISVTFAPLAVGRRWLQVTNADSSALRVCSAAPQLHPPSVFSIPPYRHKHPWANVAPASTRPVPPTPSWPARLGWNHCSRGPCPKHELSSQFPTPAIADKPLRKQAEQESLPLLITHL